MTLTWISYNNKVYVVSNSLITHPHTCIYLNFDHSKRYRNTNWSFSGLFRNNAGISAFPFTLSKDNIELQFATNHLGMKEMSYIW